MSHTVTKNDYFFTIFKDNLAVIMCGVQTL